MRNIPKKSAISVRKPQTTDDDLIRKNFPYKFSVFTHEMNVISDFQVDEISEIELNMRIKEFSKIAKILLPEVRKFMPKTISEPFNSLVIPIDKTTSMSLEEKEGLLHAWSKLLGVVSEKACTFFEEFRQWESVGKNFPTQLRSSLDDFIRYSDIQRGKHSKEELEERLINIFMILDDLECDAANFETFYKDVLLKQCSAVYIKSTPEDCKLKEEEA